MLRSLLFVPGDRPERFDKALASGADAVIQDLEDAVAPQNKEQARRAVAQSLAPGGPGSARRFVRINGLDTVHSYDDVHEVVRFGLEAIVLPKTQTAHDVHVLSYLLDQIEPRRNMAAGTVGIVPLIETGLGTRHVAEIAGASQRVRMLTFGAVDLSVELGLDIAQEAQTLEQLRWQIVTGSRLIGVAAPIDTVFIDLADADGLAASAARARARGFQGKLCLHPKQVTVVNEAFSPSVSEIEKARAIEKAARESGSGVVSLDGKMVDKPVVEWARQTLDYARRAGRL